MNAKRPCVQCGGELPEKRSKFCSDKCMEKWHRKNRKGKARRTTRRTTLKPGSEPAPRKRPLSKPYLQVASPEEIMRMLEKGVVLKVIALLKKEFGV